MADRYQYMPQNQTPIAEEDEEERQFREMIASLTRSPVQTPVQRPADSLQTDDEYAEVMKRRADEEAALLEEIAPTEAQRELSPDRVPPTPADTDMDVSLAEIENYDRRDVRGGVPAKQPSGSAWSAATEHSSRETTPIKPADNYHDTAGRVADSGPGTGERPNQFGYEDEKLTYDRNRLMNEAAAAYDRVSEGKQQDPDWTLEFTSQHSKMSDKDIQRAYRLQSLMWGPQHGMRYREMLQKEQADYETGLGKARDRDLAEQGGGRISKGLAQAMVAARAVTPEVAATLRKGDELVRAFTNGGGLAQASRQEQMEQRYHLNNINNDQKMAALREQLNRMEAERLSRERMAAEANASRERAAALRPRPGAATAGQPKPEKLTPAELEGIKEAYIAKTMSQPGGRDFTPEQARAILDGNMEGLTADEQRSAQLALRQLPGVIKDPLAIRSLLTTEGKERFSAESRSENKIHNAVRQSIELAQNNVKDKRAWQQKWGDTAATFKRADKAWREMSAEGRANFVELSSKNLAGDIRNYRFSEEDQVRAAALHALVNELIKARSGSAVTGSEWDRIAAELGMTNGAWSPFASAGAISEHLNHVYNALRRHRFNFEGTSGGWLGPEGRE